MGWFLGLEVHNQDAGKAFFLSLFTKYVTDRTDSNLWRQLRLVCHNCSNLWQSSDWSVTMSTSGEQNIQNIQGALPQICTILTDQEFSTYLALFNFGALYK